MCVRRALTLSFELSQKMQERLTELRNAYVQVFADLQRYSESEKEAIHRHARISQVGASTRIENALLTDLEVQWVDTLLTSEGKPTDFQKYKDHITDKLSKDRERSIEEVAGCRSMLMLVYEQARDMLPLRASHLRGMHFELMQYYPKAAHHAGQYKIQANTVIERNHRTNQERIVLQPATPGLETETAMQELLEWYNQTVAQSNWTVAVATEMVGRFLAIHPFQDGNGRLGRGLFLMALFQSPELALREVSRYLAIDRHIEKKKQEYYWVLAKLSDGKFKKRSEDYDFSYFLKFMIKVLFEALADIPFYRNKQRTIEQLSETALEILHCFEDEPEKRLTTAHIVEATKIARRTVINNLNHLVDKKLLQRLGQGAATRYQLTF